MTNSLLLCHRHRCFFTLHWCEHWLYVIHCSNSVDQYVHLDVVMLHPSMSTPTRLPRVLFTIPVVRHISQVCIFLPHNVLYEFFLPIAELHSFLLLASCKMFSFRLLAVQGICITRLSQIVSSFCCSDFSKDHASAS